MTADEDDQTSKDASGGGVPADVPFDSERAYTADDIQVLEGLEAVRKRPGMYIGDTGPRGMHHLVYEIVDNSIDEAMAGFCENIVVRITSDGGVIVTDDGRGIPTDINVAHGLPGVTIAMTKLHAGGKFKKDVYQVSGGLHGVGASVVNALSEVCEVEVFQNGKIHFQAFSRGESLGDLETQGSTERTGTKVFFKPDRQIFGDVEFDASTLAGRFKELAFLNKGVNIKFVDERSEPPVEEQYYFEGGITEFVQHLNEARNPLHTDVIYVEKQEEGVSVEIAAQFHDGYQENVQSFANNIRTIEGGTHVSGFRSALSSALGAYARNKNLFKSTDKPNSEDFREGLTCVISVKVPEPQFEGQTKTKLGNNEVDGIVRKIWGEALRTHLEENPRTARGILDKVIQAFQAREAARKARDLVRRKKVLSGGGLPGRLADCSSNDSEITELFLVEGDSAGGSAKQGRDRETQAILPLNGKILNVEKARIDKMLAHEEIRNLITAVGTGIGLEDFDLEKCRYGKIIIMTDADVDGSHIRTLLLTFLFRHMRGLIEAGRVFIAQPPLYLVKKGKSSQYIFEDEELQPYLQSLGAAMLTLDVAEPAAVNGASDMEGVRLMNFSDALRRIEAMTRPLARRGLTMEEYLGAVNEKGQLPTGYAVSTRAPSTRHFLYGEDGLAAFLQEEEALRGGKPVRVVEEDDDTPTGDGDVLVTRIYEHAEIQEQAARVLDFGVKLAAWESEGPEGPVLFHLHRKGSSEPEELRSLSEVLEAVGRLSQRGVDVTRYKGLGEMNADQLADTTMDIDKRILLRVTMSDATEADRLFSLLMGELVEPRRKFIQEHALEVVGLDL